MKQGFVRKVFGRVVRAVAAVFGKKQTAVEAHAVAPETVRVIEKPTRKSRRTGNRQFWTTVRLPSGYTYRVAMNYRIAA